jgi:putative tryptophan/tyrosine transport system substrate-binding protein
MRLLSLDEADMRRRDFITLIGGAAAWPIVAQAQSPQSVRRIGVIMGLPESDRQGQACLQAFRLSLESRGWVVGRNIQIDDRWAEGDPGKARSYAMELIRLAPSVIVTHTNQVTEIVRRETDSIPIVFASLGDPVGSGLVASLNRPGGNVTGFPVFVNEMGSKWLELLREIAPQVNRVGFLFHPDAAPHIGLLKAAEAAAPSLNFRIIPIPIRDAVEIERGIPAAAINREIGGLLTASHAVTYSNRNLIIDLAARHRLPTIFGDRLFSASGGLLSYGSNIPELFRGAASYVDLILKGAKPGGLPVQMPTKFELVINLKTAKALGLTIPPTLLIRADEVIE